MHREEPLQDANANSIGRGLFYLGPDPANEMRARMYYARGYEQIKGSTVFTVENSRGEIIELDPLMARQLHALSEDAIMTAINSGRVTIENGDWFKKRSGKRIKNNRVVQG